MENALSHITVLPATKSEIKNFVEKAKLEICNGVNNPLQINIALKCIEEMVKALRSDPDVKDAIQYELDKYAEKSFDAFGATLTKTSRTDYDFTTCGDPVYADLVNQADKLKAMIKAREELLKTGIDPATGETFAPPKTSTSEILQIKLK